MIGMLHIEQESHKAALQAFKLMHVSYSIETAITRCLDTQLAANATRSPESLLYYTYCMHYSICILHVCTVAHVHLTCTHKYSLSLSLPPFLPHTHTYYTIH